MIWLKDLIAKLPVKYLMVITFAGMLAYFGIEFYKAETDRLVRLAQAVPQSASESAGIKPFNGGKAGEVIKPVSFLPLRAKEDTFAGQAE